MRIATLQFTPTLGDVAASIAYAESLLYKDESRLRNLDLLVLPELAFTGTYRRFPYLSSKYLTWPFHYDRFIW
jgi:predicted amidohydrolase